MRFGALVIGAAALLALTTGCGDTAEPGQAAPGAGPPAGGPPAAAIELADVDACTLVSDDELRAFFGESAGEKTPNGAGFIKGCALDNASGSWYVHVSVQATPLGDKKQFDFDKSETKQPIDLSGVGDEAFGRYTDTEAGVEARHRGALVHLVLIPYGDDKLDDPAGTLDKLTVLTKQAIARL
jgi:hypothetical protein